MRLRSRRWTLSFVVILLTHVSVAAESLVYVANSNGTVSVVSNSTHMVVATIPASSAGPGAVTPNGAFVYLGRTVISTATNSVVATIALPSGWSVRDVAITSNGQIAYLLAMSPDAPPLGSVFVVATATNQVVATIPTVNFADIEITPDGAFAYVGGDDNSFSEIEIIDTATNTIVDHVVVPDSGTAVDIVFTPDGQRAYVSSGTNVLVVDTASRSVVATVPVSVNADELAVTPDGAFVYVTLHSLVDGVAVLNTASNTITKIISTFPFSVQDIGITPEGNFAYAASPSANSLLLINTLSNTIVNLIPVGPGPSALVITPNLTIDTNCGRDVGTATVVARSGFSAFILPQLQLQLVGVANNTSQPINGPITFVMTNLSNAVVVGTNTTTRCFSPAPSPYVSVRPGSDNLLSPGETVIIPVLFLQTQPGSITYSQRVISGLPTGQ